MGEKNTNLNFDKICRACLSEYDLKSIFHRSPKDGLTFAEKIMACTSVQVAKDDGYPANICKTCCKQVNQFYSFKQKCEKTYNFLQLHNYEVKGENSGNNEEKCEKTYNFLQLHNYGVKRENGNSNDNIYLFEGIKNNAVQPIKLETNNISIISSENDGENFFSLFGEDDNKDNIIKTESENLDQDDNSSLKCTKNKKRFRCKKKYNNYFANQKREKPFVCQICEKKFKTGFNRARHIKTHTGEQAKRVSCPTCNKECSVNNIYRHMRFHTHEKPFTCHICGKSFTTEFNRGRHIKTHTGERPFECTICGKGFIQAVTLEAHIRVHTGVLKNKNNRENAEWRYVCDICNRRFISRSVLQTHKMQHAEKSFLCSECGKMFISQGALKIHGAVHSGTKQYTCHICKKSFSYSSSLKKHLTRHTGEKRFSCHLCGNKFLQNAHLKTHLKLHEGIKPFKCSVCGKNFSLKGNLTVHMRIHTGQRPHQCLVCGKGFYSSSSMRKHHQSHVKNTKLD